ncbi:MAG: immune inhibitor A, partial [Candidatus Zambryskibacteria bacterium]|nr:immune inhibitor A [Candidatus Zambryskibacteria bacterium]
DFAELYHNFSIAMLINSTQAGGKFAIKTFPSFSLDIGDSTVPNPEAFYTPGAPPWGTDYIWLEGDYDDLDRLSFNGVDYSTNDSAWTSDGDVLWSGTGDMLDNWAIFEATGGGILSFDALWDLEDYWDFGFVQISTDGGYTWTSLVDNEGYSTYDHDPSAHPTVVANLPGLTSWITTWDTLTYDLSAYSGQDILIAFRMVTDWATYYGGWWIDNVYIDETLISDGSDVNIFMDITEVLPINNDFTVTFVGEKVSGKSKHEFKVLRMGFNSDTEDRLFELKQMFKWATSIVMLVTFDAPEGFTGYANYSYDWIPKTTGPKK